MGMNVSEYAKHRGVSHVAVLKALKSGRIKKESDGKINPDKADKAWAANTDPSQQRVRPTVNTSKKEPDQEPARTQPSVPPLTGATPAPVQHSREPSVNPSAANPAAAKGLPSFAESKAVHEFFKAQSAKLEFETLRKTLVSRKEVDDEIFEENRRVRDRLQNIPARIAPLLAAVTDIREIETMLSKEIYDALVELSS